MNTASPNTFEALTELIVKATHETLECYQRAHRADDDPQSRSELLDMAARRRKALDLLWEAARTLASE